MQEKYQNREVILDFLRIFLVLMIFFFHSRIHLRCNYGMMNDFIISGNFAMTAFYMLSGYCLQLVYKDLYADNWDKIKLFYFKRFIAVYPLYIICGTIFSVMCIIAGIQSIDDNIKLLPVEILGIQSTFTHSLFQWSHNSGTWFVSCLLLCYLIFPLLNVFIHNIDIKKGLTIILLLSLINIFAQYVAYWFQTTSLYANPFFRIMEFFIGMVIGCISHKIKPLGNHYHRIWLVLSLIAAIIVLITGVSLAKNKGWVTDLMFVIPCFCILLFSSPFLHFTKAIHSHKIANSRKLAFLSEISYAFFLAQFFVWLPMKFILRTTGIHIPNFLLILLMFVLCMLVSLILNRTIERPIKRYLSNKFIRPYGGS